jgi:hypothetical protein
MEDARRRTRQRALRALWADKRFADFDPQTGPTVDFTERGVAGGCTGVGGF